MNTSRHAWQYLALGIANSVSLKKLSFNLIQFTPQFMEDLTPGLTNCASLQVLDLSYNGISDLVGQMLGKILRN